LFNDAVVTSYVITALNGNMTVNYELGRMWKEAVVTAVTENDPKPLAVCLIMMVL